MPLELAKQSLESVFSSATYEEFKQKLANSHCDKCPQLCENRHTIVVDRGVSHANIVFIGEAPGETEDLQGKAFVGRSGRLLDKLMAEIGIDTNRDVLIINVVKCRPPDNRAPTEEEARQCQPYLHWQLKKVQPKVVVLLGATALKHIAPELKKQPMKNLVGQFFTVPDYPGTQFQLLYHPAFLLRDPRKIPQTRELLASLRRYLDQAA